MDEQKDNTRDEQGRFKPGYKPQTAWQPGECPNPAGRPPNEGSITWWMRELLKELNGGGKPVAHTIARRTIAEAKKGKPWAVSELIDRTEGKPTQRTELSGPDGGPIAIDDVKATLDSKLARLATRGGAGRVPGEPDAG
jgi:hypothetical protein